MKKVFVIILLNFTLIGSLFAGTILFPYLGYENRLVMDKNPWIGGSNSQDRSVELFNEFHFGFSIGVNKNNFIFYWDNMFSFSELTHDLLINTNTGKIERHNANIEQLIWYDTSLLFGGAFNFLQNSLHLILAVGHTVSSLVSYKVFDDYNYEWLNFELGPMGFGCTFHIGFEYYFSKHIGLGITMDDTIGYMADVGGMYLFPIGFFNKFRLSLGPKFRL